MRYPVSSTFFLCTLVLFFAAFASGQSRTNTSGTGGIHVVSGRIYTPSGRAIDGQIKVKLESNSYTELSLITDQSGGYAFTNLAPGAYTVTVDAGDNFEVFHESVLIDPAVPPPPGVFMPPTPKTFSVPVYLRPKATTKRADQQAPGVVNVKYADAPPEAIKHYEAGLAMVKANKEDAALAEFKQAITAFPGLEPAYVESGKIYLKKSRLGDAIGAFSLAVRYDPRDFDARLNYGIALYRDNKFDDAQKALVDAASLNASAVWPHYYLGLIYIQKKDLDDAQSQLETAKGLKGENNIPMLHRALGGIYAAKKLNLQAAAELEKYIQLSPDARDADRIRQTIAELKKNQ